MIPFLLFFSDICLCFTLILEHCWFLQFEVHDLPVIHAFNERRLLFLCFERLRDVSGGFHPLIKLLLTIRYVRYHHPFLDDFPEKIVQFLEKWLHYIVELPLGFLSNWSTTLRFSNTSNRMRYRKSDAQLVRICEFIEYFEYLMNPGVQLFLYNPFFTITLFLS